MSTVAASLDFPLSCLVLTSSPFFTNLSFLYSRMLAVVFSLNLSWLVLDAISKLKAGKRF